MSESSAVQVRHVPTSVTVIVPVRNGAHTIDTQLDALQEQSYTGQFEILVSDNGSTDDLVELLNRRQGRGRVPVGYVSADEFPSVSHARNVAARQANGEFLVFCDADDVVRPGWLGQLVATAETADLVSGSLDTSVLNSVAAYRRRPLRPSNQGFETDFLPYAPGCNVGVWASVFDAVHGFDVAMTDGGEDIDFSWRVQLAGYRIAHAGAAVVDYRLRPTVREFWTQVRRYAVGDVQLFVAYRAYGFGRVSTFVWAKHVLRLLITNPAVPQVLSRFPRGRWTGAAAIVVGHLQGSIRYRTLFF